MQGIFHLGLGIVFRRIGVGQQAGQDQAGFADFLRSDKGFAIFRQGYGRMAVAFMGQAAQNPKQG